MYWVGLVALLTLAWGCPQSPRQCGERPLSEQVMALRLRGIEKARYPYVLDRPTSFDDAYPLTLFEGQARTITLKECVLGHRYGISISSKDLDGELNRIDSNTQAPSIWGAMKESLGQDRCLIRQVICRPLLVDRLLRAFFSKDRRIHAAPFAQAEAARERLLRGSPLVGEGAFSNVRLCVEVGDLLHPEFSGGEPLPLENTSCDGIHGIVAQQALEAFQSGARVTPVLEDSERFYVLEKRGSMTHVRINGYTVSKLDYDEWVYSSGPLQWTG